MAPAVDTGDFDPAALAVQEIDRFPDAALPGVLADSERRSELVSCFDDVGSWPANLGEIQKLILAERGGNLLDRLGENSLPGLLIHDREI